MSWRCTNSTIIPQCETPEIGQSLGSPHITVSTEQPRAEPWDLGWPHLQGGWCRSVLPADTSQGAAAEAAWAGVGLVRTTVTCLTPVTACTPHSWINSRYIVLQRPKAAAQLLMAGTVLVWNRIEYSMCTSFEHMSYFPCLCPAEI